MPATSQEGIVVALEGIPTEGEVRKAVDSTKECAQARDDDKRSRLPWNGTQCGIGHQGICPGSQNWRNGATSGSTVTLPVLRIPWRALSDGTKFVCVLLSDCRSPS